MNQDGIVNEAFCPPGPSARRHDATAGDVLDTGVMLSKTAKRCPRSGRTGHLTRDIRSPTVQISNGSPAGARCPAVLGWRCGIYCNNAIGSTHCGWRNQDTGSGIGSAHQPAGGGPVLERFVRALCLVEQELRKEKTSESLLLHEDILPGSKERSAMGTVFSVSNGMKLTKG